MSILAQRPDIPFDFCARILLYGSLLVFQEERGKSANS